MDFISLLPASLALVSALGSFIAKRLSDREAATVQSVEDDAERAIVLLGGALRASELAAQKLAEDIEANRKTRDQLKAEVEQNRALAEQSADAREALDGLLARHFQAAAKGSRRSFWLGQLSGFLIGIAASLVATFLWSRFIA